MKKILIAILSLVALVACSKQLEIEQYGVLNKQTFYNTQEDVNGALTAIYADIGGAPSFTGGLEYYYFFTKELLSGDFYGVSNAHGNDPLWWLHDYTFDAGNEMIRSLFVCYYSIIGKCNALLDNVKPTYDYGKSAIAQAQVARAWMYFELTTLWGNPPLVDHVMGGEESAKGNTEPEKLWEFIENDLNSAIDSGMLTSKKSISDKDNYLITQEFAHALLGKALLWQGKNEQAAKQFDFVINSHLYGLLGIDEPGEYEDLLTITHENCCESIFESNFVRDDANSANGIRMYPVFTSISAMMYDITDNDLGLNSFTGGGGSPSMELIEGFKAHDGENGYRFNQSIKSFEFMANNGFKLNNMATYYFSGCVFWKNRVEAESVGVNGFSCYNNIRWMRYAEVLLLAAEANLGIDQTKVDKYLNAVRTRAKLTPISGATLQDIKDEKHYELCGEGVYFQDLLRWKDAYNTLKDQGKDIPICRVDGSIEITHPNTDYGFKEGKHDRLPYPSSEMRVNREIRQNPKW